VVLGDFLKALDLPVTVDLATRKATGWAFKEAHRVDIDLASNKVVYGARQEPLKDHEVRETPEGWCVDTGALARWFTIGIKPLTSSSALLLESEAKLPVEMAMERQKRAASLLRKAQFDLRTIPNVRLPYRMWRAPALDFVVSAGATYRAKDGVRIDRSTSIFAAGEIAQFSYDAQIGSNGNGVPNRLRLRGHRSDPNGGLLGPLKATHVGFGDVEGFDSRLSGNARDGRGALITNRPLFRPTAFARTQFEGDLPAGWEAEIYRNNELVAFTRPTADHRYRFEDVELRYGDNDVKIVLYGPQGQIRTREEMVNVGKDNVPAGKTWYWAGFNQPGRNLVSLPERSAGSGGTGSQAAASVEHGLNERTSVGILARTMLLQDERLTFVEGSVRRSIGHAAIELSASYQSNGGKAVGGEIIGKLGAIHFRGEALITKDFNSRSATPESLRDVRISADAPVRLGRALVPVRTSVRITDHGNGSKQIEAAARASTAINRFNLATDIVYRKKSLNLGQPPPPQLDWSVIGSGRIGNIRVRGSSTFRLLPERMLETVEVSGYWTAGKMVDWEGGLVYDALRQRANARLSHIRRLSTAAVAVTAEAASDRSVALGLNLNFSLDPKGMTLSRQPLAGAGAVRARVYQDLNGNGVREASEPLQKGALITTGTRLSEHRTGDDGTIIIGGLTAYQPIAVGIDEASLGDPSLAPRNALQVVTPRPGVSAEVEIGLVGAGAIEGAVVKSGEIGFEGLDLEVVDGTGRVIATARSDFDGFFLFDRVPYGTYRVRIAQNSAVAAKVLQEIAPAVTIASGSEVARLGAIHVQPLPQIASASP
jgi:hypothetical protein